MISVQALKRWLEELEPNSAVGIDDGGLSLCVMIDGQMTGAELEVGGIPERRYLNHYRHCGQEWNDVESCMWNDRCPVCNAEIEPYASEELAD